MTDTPDLFECRLVGYSKQSRKDGDWVEVRFHIHPDDVTPALAQAPLKTTFMVAATPADAPPTITYVKLDEKPKRSWDEIPLSEQAGIRAKEPAFQTFLRAMGYSHWLDGETPENILQYTQDAIRHQCCVKSRSELSPDNEAGQAWIKLDQEYQESFGLIAERTT